MFRVPSGHELHPAVAVMGFLFPCDGFPRKAAVTVAGIDPPLSDYMLDGYQQEQFLKLHPTKNCLPTVVEFAPHAAYA